MLQQYKLAEGAKLTARRLTQNASSHKTLIPEDEQKAHLKDYECWAQRSAVGGWETLSHNSNGITFLHREFSRAT